MAKPNLFNFATSELSQDAALAWLFAWSDSKCRQIDAAMHELARHLMRLVYDLHGHSAPDALESVKVRTQVDGIDVLVEVDGTDAILIEDKVGTRPHSDQLRRYLELLERDHDFMRVLPTYVQTFEQPAYDMVEEAGYKVVVRADLIELLERYRNGGGSNDIALDFYTRLRSIDHEFKAYRTEALERWDSYAWRGFFQELQAEIGRGDWGYVPNRSGGFVGFWFGYRRTESVKLYLQLEEDHACFKISTKGDTADRRRRRTRWHKRIVEAAREMEIPVRKPARFGDGQTMTVAVFDRDYRTVSEDECVDIMATAGNLRDLAKVLKRAVARA